MTEKEKMLSGQMYICNEELIMERRKAKELLYEFNNLRPDKVEEKKEILKLLFANLGNNANIEEPLRCDYGYNTQIGDNFYANYNLVILDCATVKIGNNVLIGPNVGIYTAGHSLDIENRKKGYEFAKKIEIKDNVWIGGGSIICPGVTIGENTVIGAGSVVTRDIPSNVIAFGNPCKVKNY